MNSYGERGQLWLSHLTKEHSNNTCGPYRYTITKGATAHTVYVTREGLQRWLSERGLVIDDATVLEERGTSCRIVFDKLSAAVMRGREVLKDNPAFLADLEKQGRERELIYKTMAQTGLRKKTCFAYG